MCQRHRCADHALGEPGHFLRRVDLLPGLHPSGQHGTSSSSGSLRQYGAITLSTGPILAPPGIDHALQLGTKRIDHHASALCPQQGPSQFGVITDMSEQSIEGGIDIGRICARRNDRIEQGYPEIAWPVNQQHLLILKVGVKSIDQYPRALGCLAPRPGRIPSLG